MGNCLQQSGTGSIQSNNQTGTTSSPQQNRDINNNNSNTNDIQDRDSNTNTNNNKQNNNERRNSFESETKQILNDDDIFSREAIRISYEFWNDNVLILSLERRQEIGVTLYAQMFRKMPECRKIFLRGDIEKTSEKFLGMMGWLIMELTSQNVNVWTKVKKLGKLHRSWGISYEHYLPMLEAFHLTFQEQFPKVYTLRIKFCIENLFMNAAKIMTEKDFVTLFAERVQDLETLEFLDSLDACLAHSTGREYFERYLEQTFCAEYVLFLRAFDEFKQLGNSQQRYEKAKQIYLTNFHINAQAPIELNNKLQQENIDKLMEKLDYFDKQQQDQQQQQQQIELNENLLDDIYADVKEIIEQQSWDKFHAGIYSIKQATRINSY